MIQRVVLVGAGNLATQTGAAMQRAGLDIVQIYNRTGESARQLALRLGTHFITDTAEIDPTADLILIAVSDEAIIPVSTTIKAGSAIVVHTAGSVPLEALAGCGARYGVFYPLQTFSKARDVDFHDIPICLEADTPATMKALKDLAARLSQNVFEIDSQQRKILHLAAVFVCNFVNHFYHVGGRLLENNGMPFALLRPLIRETAEKVMEMYPCNAQTGPARRADREITGRHMEMLVEHPELKELYNIITESIIKEYKRT